MFDKLLEGLTNQGVMGIMLALLILMFVRFFNKTFDAQVERDRAGFQFMQNVLAILQEIKSSCVACRSEIISSEVAKLGAAEDRIIDAIQDMGKFIVAETRRDNDLSRPHMTPSAPTPTPAQPYATAESNLRRVP
jgi:hypothetical protein